MTNQHTSVHNARFSAGVYWLATFVLFLAAGGLFFVLRFGELAYQRDLQDWQSRLNLIADSRAQDVRQWVDAQFSTLQALADNASLQLYLTELTMVPDDNTEEASAEASYLRTLLTFTAQQGGFTDGSENAPRISANVEPLAGGGIAITDMGWTPIVATYGFPPIDTELKEQLYLASLEDNHLLDMARLPGKGVRMGFLAPIYAIQGERNASGQIGWAIGLRSIDDNGLFARLKHPGATEKTLEALLVRKQGDEAVYLSPLQDKSQALEKRLSLDTKDLAAAFALAQPGTFSIKRDYAFQPVLMTSRPVAGTPWVMLLKINQQEALADSKAWRSRMTVILMLGVALAIVLIIAAWWYGTSKEATALAASQRRLAEKYAEQERLLRLVTDNEPESLFIVDEESRCHFANRRAAELAGIAPEDMQGKSLASLLGPARAETYEEANQEAMASGKPCSRIRQVEIDEVIRTFRSEHVPLEHIPLVASPGTVPGVLVVEQDITEAVSEREHRERILRQLIDTLVRQVDERDPHAANHSTAVARLAREIAHEMGLDHTLCETADLAGKLMNIGKIVIPQELLMKKGLDREEKETIRDSLLGSARILEAIEFDGPVVDTLRQTQERFDGSGPEKMKGDEILVTARIIAVANVFVAMTSPRSYREAIDADKATLMLLEEADKAYDRKVVVALINYLDNRGGRAELEAERTAEAV